jgi:hypothetical protein
MTGKCRTSGRRPSEVDLRPEDNRPLSQQDEPEEPVILPFPRKVKCRERLGGLLKHYERAAA